MSRLDSVSLYYGKSFTGKTARMLHDLRNEERVCLVDPKCAQLADLKGWRHFWPEYSEEFNRWSDGAMLDYFRERLSAFFRVLVHFRFAHRENLELLCQTLSAVKDCVLAVDELSIFLPQGARPTRYINSLVVSGTHDGIRFWGTAQRPSLVHPTVRANASKMTIFRMTEQNDLDAIKPYLPPSFFEQLSTLPDQVPICWTDGFEPYIDCDLAGKLRVLPSVR